MLLWARAPNTHHPEKRKSSKSPRFLYPRKNFRAFRARFSNFFFRVCQKSLFSSCWWKLEFDLLIRSNATISPFYLSRFFLFFFLFFSVLVRFSEHKQMRFLASLNILVKLRSSRAEKCSLLLMLIWRERKSFSVCFCLSWKPFSLVATCWRCYLLLLLLMCSLCSL